MAAKQQAEPQVLLFVFLNTFLPKDHSDEEASNFHSGQGGQLKPIMCVDKTLDELGSFADLVSESKSMKQDWKIVLLACLSGRNGVAPNSDEVEYALKIMVQTVEDGGDLSKYMAFDRDGTVLHFS
ncbi:MAG TPA: ribonucleotide reductase subunit alpha [Gammaproteobacteria bacterium]|nr:ribonucleotide reductase subunit alpha [Gammaproteobacteria bacterium]